MTEILRLSLAAILAVAGVAKLVDRAGSRRTARAFGAPGWVGIAVPLVEIGVALLLVPAPTARAAAAAVAGLFVVFSIAIANALLRGRVPDCGCLGKLHSSQASWRTIARNAALAALALVVAVQPAGALSWVEGAVALVGFVVVAQAILAVTLFRRYGRALARIEALERPPAEPAAVPASSSGNSSPRVALAGAAAGAMVATAAAAQAASKRSSALDPELQAIDDVLRAAEPRLAAASRRSLTAVRAQATLNTGDKLRQKRAAARRALAAERVEILALRASVKPLAATGSTAHNVKMMVDSSLSLYAQSLEKRRQAIGAQHKAALRLITDSETLWLRAVGSSAAAGELLGRGQ